MFASIISTDSDIVHSLPSDELISQPMAVIDSAFNIKATPEEFFLVCAAWQAER
jgi:hypothetical protein